MEDLRICFPMGGKQQESRMAFLRECQKFVDQGSLEEEKNKFWTNYAFCKFYEKPYGLCTKTNKGCNQRIANKCKYAKMQAMERHEGIATEITFRWRGDYGIVEFSEPYITYARIQYMGSEYEFRFLFELVKEKCLLTDEYGKSLGGLHNRSITYYDESKG